MQITINGQYIKPSLRWDDYNKMPDKKDLVDYVAIITKGEGLGGTTVIVNSGNQPIPLGVLEDIIKHAK